MSVSRETERQILGPLALKYARLLLKVTAESRCRAVK